jgi:hypothetical protein
MVGSLSVPVVPCPFCFEPAEHTAESRHQVDYHCAKCNRPFTVWPTGGPMVAAAPDPSATDAIPMHERTRDVLGSLRSARLVHVNVEPNQEYELGISTRVGRHPMCELQILDRSIEREHFLLAVTVDGSALLTPLGVAKVFVDDELVMEAVSLRAGQRIRAGRVELVYEPWELLVAAG